MTPIVAGSAAGLGVTMVIAQILPKPPPELRSAVARLNTPLMETGSVRDEDRRRNQDAKRDSILPDSWLRWLTGSGLLRAASTDLALLGRNAENHALAKITAGVAGLLFVPILTLAAAVAGLKLPLAVPVGLSIIVGVFCFFGPDIEVKTESTKARTVFHKVLHGYLVNIAMERRANRGILQALEEAASVGDSWVLARIRTTLIAAQMSNTTPWLALEELGAEIGVMHLVETAQTMRSASEEGTAVFSRLIAQADSLGDAVLSEERAIANARSERLVIPVSALAIVILAIMMYPLMARLKYGM